MKVDALSRIIVASYVENAGASHSALASKLQVSEEAIRGKLANLRDGGIISTPRASVDEAELGYPYEAFILSMPSSQTTREHLEALAATPLVTRVFTLATHRSVAFTVRGTSPDDVCQRGEELARIAELEDIASVMLVDVISDDPALGVARALATPQENTKILESSATN